MTLSLNFTQGGNHAPLDQPPDTADRPSIVASGGFFDVSLHPLSIQRQNAINLALGKPHKRSIDEVAT